MMKRVLLLMAGCLFGVAMKAQHQQTMDDFRKEAGDQAEMFAGKMDGGYPSTVYLNHPYWWTEDFAAGQVMYGGLLYKDVQMRYDAYREQLVVKTPVKKMDVRVPMDKVENFSIGGTRFDRRNGEMVAVLFTSPRMELVERMDISLKQKQVDNVKVQMEFDREVKYLLLRDGQVYEVSSQKSLLKLFPAWRKELRSYARQRGLDFKAHRQSALMALVSYADQLLNQP